MPDVSFGRVPFAEQIEFFRRKLGNQLPTNAWTDIWQEAHDHAFVVAGANRVDLLSDLAGAVDKVIAKGGTLEDFRKDFDGIVARHGWSYHGGRNWRSRVIYETNLRTSHAAGRWQQLQGIKKDRPYWLYVHRDGERHPRPMHKHWGDMRLTLHADDPWWHTNYPPNGWGCGCTVRALNARDLKRMGKDKPDQAPDLQMHTVTIGQRSPGGPRDVETPTGVDPGFSYAPGRDIWQREQATRALATTQAQTKADWEPMIRVSAQDYGRPRKLPVQPAPVALAPSGQSENAMIDTLRQAIGSETKVYDVQGLPVIVDALTLAAHLAPHPERSTYLPLIDDLLRDPQEVWLQLERARHNGAYRIRARIFKAYQLDKGRSLLFVGDQQDGVLVSWTYFVSRDWKYINRERQGLLWFSQ